MPFPVAPVMVLADTVASTLLLSPGVEMEMPSPVAPVAPVMVLADTVAFILLLSLARILMPEYAVIRFPLMVTSRHALTLVPAQILAFVEVATITLSEIVTLDFTTSCSVHPAAGCLETERPKLTRLNPETVAEPE